MKKTNIFSNNRLFKESLGSALGPIPTIIEIEDLPSKCPACSSANVRRKGKAPNRRVVLHSDNGQLKRIILLRQRCQCRDCNSTFFSSSYDFENNGPLTLKAADAITKTVLEYPDTSVNSVAKTIEKLSGLSSSSAIDRLIKKRARDISDAVKAVPCYKLFCLPFKYKSRKGCCAIVGLKKTEKKLFLLDIISDSSIDQLENFFKKIDPFQNNAKLFLADINKELLSSIETLYDGRVGILRGLVSQRIDACQDKHFALDEKYTALNELKKVIETDLKEKYYYEALTMWENDHLRPNSPLSVHLRPIYDEILSFKKECWVGTFHRPWEPEFSMLINIIKTHERNNLSFDFMAFRLLYANRAATGTLDGKNILRYVQNINTPIEGPIREFGIDIRALYNEIYDEEHIIDHLL